LNTNRKYNLELKGSEIIGSWLTLPAVGDGRFYPAEKMKLTSDELEQRDAIIRMLGMIYTEHPEEFEEAQHIGKLNVDDAVKILRKYLPGLTDNTLELIAHPLITTPWIKTTEDTRRLIKKATIKLYVLKKEQVGRELSLTDYDKLYTFNELREMCRERGIHSSGDKKALISKLLSQETWDLDEIKSKIQALPPDQRQDILTKYPGLAME